MSNHEDRKDTLVMNPALTPLERATPGAIAATGRERTACGGYLLLLNQWRGFSPGNVLQMPYAYADGSTSVYVAGALVSDCWSIHLAGSP